MKNLIATRYKYRGYWIKVIAVVTGQYDTKTSYQVVIWIVGAPENKEILIDFAYSRGQGEAQAEHHIDRVLFCGGVMS